MHNKGICVNLLYPAIFFTDIHSVCIGYAKRERPSYSLVAQHHENCHIRSVPSLSVQSVYSYNSMCTEIFDAVVIPEYQQTDVRVYFNCSVCLSVL